MPERQCLTCVTNFWILIISIHTSRFGSRIKQIWQPLYAQMGTYAWKTLYSKILPANSRARRSRPAAQAAPSQAVHKNLATGSKWDICTKTEIESKMFTMFTWFFFYWSSSSFTFCGGFNISCSVSSFFFSPFFSLLPYTHLCHCPRRGCICTWGGSLNRSDFYENKFLYTFTNLAFSIPAIDNALSIIAIACLFTEQVSDLFFVNLQV